MNTIRTLLTLIFLAAGLLASVQTPQSASRQPQALPPLPHCDGDCDSDCFHYASALISYAKFLASRGEPERAEQTYLKAASILEDCFRFTLESREVLKELFCLHRSRGDYGRAIVVLKRIFWKTQPASPALAEVYLDFADIYSRQKDWKNALDSCRRALGILEKIYGPSHPAVAQVVAQLAELNMKLGRYGFADLLYDRLIRIRMEELDIPSLAQTWRRWAQLCRMTGRFTEAEALESRATRVLELRH